MSNDLGFLVVCFSVSTVVSAAICGLTWRAVHKSAAPELPDNWLTTLHVAAFTSAVIGGFFLAVQTFLYAWNLIERAIRLIFSAVFRLKLSFPCSADRWYRAASP